MLVIKKLSKAASREASSSNVECRCKDTKAKKDPVFSWKIGDIRELVRHIKDSTGRPTESTTLRAHRA